MGPLGHSLAAVAAVGLAPVVAGALAVKPSLRRGLRERLGASSAWVQADVWVHGASVGEAMAVTRVAERLAANGRRPFVSSITLTGRDVLRQWNPGVPSALAPIDHPWCVGATLGRVRPAALALVETELWPSLIHSAAARRIAVVILSARLSDRSFPRYRRFRRLLAGTLDSLSAVGAQSDLDAARFAELGVPESRISVTGDLKCEPPAGLASPPLDVAECLAGRTVFVAGSTHPGEERAALGALQRCRDDGIDAALVIAPRHLGRVAEVVASVERAGLRVRSRSRCDPSPLRQDEVLVLDTLGELSSVYPLARLAFVGGSLVDRGGHNLLEPVFAGVPVVFGRHVQNVRESARLVEAAGAGFRVDDAAGLTECVAAALATPDATRARGQRGREELALHRGSTDRNVALIERFCGALPVADVS